MNIKKYLISLIAIISFSLPINVEAELRLDKLFSGIKKAYTAYSLSDSQIQAYIHEYVEYSDRQNKLAPVNNPYSIRLVKLTKGLNEIDGIPLNFKVYITPEVNAFACADGSVRVYSGLMDLMNDDEILGVVGHEIGHIAHKDTKNAMKQLLLNSAIIDGLGATGDRAAALSDSQLSAIGQSLLSSKYSRKQETNADEYGYDFLKKNGKNPWAMAMAFSKLQQLEKSGSPKILTKMFSSHPQTQDRIDNIIKKCKKDKIEAPEGCDL